MSGSKCSGRGSRPTSSAMASTVQAHPAAHTSTNNRSSPKASSAGARSSTVWPSPSQRRAVSCTASRQSACTAVPVNEAAVNAIRSRPGSAPTSPANGRAGGGAQ